MVQLVNRIGQAILDDARLVVKVGPKYLLLPISTIEAVISEGNSLAIISTAGTVRVRAILSRVEALLTETTVVRVHRSMLVNLTKIVEAETVNSGEYLVKLSSGRVVPAGRKYRAVIDSLLGGFSKNCEAKAAAWGSAIG
jgi:DNA-binding LytR/AlgR family response regulator